MRRHLILALLPLLAGCDIAPDPQSSERPRRFDYPLAGAYAPDSGPARDTTGPVRFQVGFRRAGQVVTGEGHIYQTVPFRMPARSEAWSSGAQSWADVLGLTRDSQLELRQVRGDVEVSEKAPPGLCGGRSPQWLLVAIDAPTTRPRLVLAALTGEAAPGPEVKSRLCGVYRYAPVTPAG